MKWPIILLLAGAWTWVAFGFRIQIRITRDKRYYK